MDESNTASEAMHKITKLYACPIYYHGEIPFLNLRSVDMFQRERRGKPSRALTLPSPSSLILINN